MRSWKLNVRPYAGTIGREFIFWTIMPVLTESMSSVSTLNGKLLLEWTGSISGPKSHRTKLVYASENDIWASCQANNTRQLRVALLEEWIQILQFKFWRLIRSMKGRCQAVIDARGHRNRYLTQKLESLLIFLTVSIPTQTYKMFNLNPVLISTLVTLEWFNVWIACCTHDIQVSLKISKKLIYYVSDPK